MDPTTNEKFIPYCVEPSVGVERLVLSFLCDAYDEENVGKRLEDEEEKSVIAEAVALLGDREREIIELRFGLGGRREMTQKEVADMLGISQSYISRLEKKTINRLKEHIESKI